MGRDGLRSWHMDSRLQGGAFLLERIPRSDLRPHDGHLLTGLRTGPPGPLVHLAPLRHAGHPTASRRSARARPPRRVFSQACLSERGGWNFQVCARNFFGFRHALARPRGCRRGAHSSRTVSSRRRRPGPRRPTEAPRRRAWAGTASHFIPACAGSTPTTQARRPGIGDHPRMRGEHLRQVAAVDSREGSSPHAWGARGAKVSTFKPNRIIPACVGSTPSPGPTPT